MKPYLNPFLKSKWIKGLVSLRSVSQSVEILTLNLINLYHFPLSNPFTRKTVAMHPGRINEGGGRCAQALALVNGQHLQTICLTDLIPRPEPGSTGSYQSYIIILRLLAFLFGASIGFRTGHPKRANSVFCCPEQEKL